MIDRLIEIIKEAGEILKEGYYASKDVTFKGKKDLVTDYDVGIENFLKEKFKEFDGFNVIAEESDNANKEFNDSIIIDPIDGTTNFVNSVPHCAISVGVYKDKKPSIGVVYNPILDELYSAKAGEGAFLNAKLIKVSDESELKTALIATGFPYSSATDTNDLDWVIGKMRKILPNCQDIRRLGSAAIDLCMIARGSYEGYYEINLKPWDVAAGIIILQEAGGVVTNDKDCEYRLFEDKCIIASNGKIHDELLATVGK